MKPRKKEYYKSEWEYDPVRFGYINTRTKQIVSDLGRELAREFDKELLMTVLDGSTKKEMKIPKPQPQPVKKFSCANCGEIMAKIYPYSSLTINIGEKEELRCMKCLWEQAVKKT